MAHKYIIFMFIIILEIANFYQMDKSISFTFLFGISFSLKITLKAICGYPDQILSFEASALGMYCLSMSHKRDVWYVGINQGTDSIIW